jgi:hypothetical protein
MVKERKLFFNNGMPKELLDMQRSFEILNTKTRVARKNDETWDNVRKRDRGFG